MWWWTGCGVGFQVPSKQVTGKAAADDTRYGVEEGDDEGVEKIPAVVDHGPCQDVILPDRFLWQNPCRKGVELGQALQGCEDHTDKREKEEDNQKRGRRKFGPLDGSELHCAGEFHGPTPCPRFPYTPRIRRI